MLDLFLKKEIQDFIKENLTKKVSDLILQKKNYQGIPIQVLAIQIQGKQKAKDKLPTWFNHDFIIYPSSLGMEQCSSEQTAELKASLVPPGELFIDLTGGFGVDTFFFAKKFKKIFFVEKNEELLKITQHNLNTFNLNHIQFECQSAENFIKKIDFPVDCIYIDPSRRDSKQKKVFLFKELEPNVIDLFPELIKKSKLVIIKASPFLDIKKGIEELKQVEKVYIISADNECKEVLYFTSKEKKDQIVYHTINLIKGNNQLFSFSPDEEKKVSVSYSNPLTYLYDPNVAILKAGGMKSIAQTFTIKKLHNNTHLYTSDNLIKEFPGKIYKCIHICKYTRKEVQQLIPNKKATILIRNFKSSIEEIKKKLGLQDGGNEIIIATTLQNNQPYILITTKVN